MRTAKRASRRARSIPCRTRIASRGCSMISMAKDVGAASNQRVRCVAWVMKDNQEEAGVG